MPSDEALAHRSLQLAAYAIAYARLRRVDEGTVDGAFFYAASGQTHRPRMATATQIERLLRAATSDSGEA